MSLVGEGLVSAVGQAAVVLTPFNTQAVAVLVIQPQAEDVVILRKALVEGNEDELAVAVAHHGRVGVEVKAGAVTRLGGGGVVLQVGGGGVVDHGLQAVTTAQGSSGGHAQVCPTCHSRPGVQVAAFEAVGEDQVGWLGRGGGCGVGGARGYGRCSSGGER